DEDVEVELGVIGAVVGAVPVVVLVDLAGERAAPDDAPVAALAEQEHAVSRDDALTSSPNGPAVGYRFAALGGGDGVGVVDGVPLPLGRVPDDEECRHVCFSPVVVPGAHRAVASTYGQ